MVPTELRSTIDLLRRSYPNGIFEADYMPLLSLLYNEGNMSIRTLSQTLGELYGRPYVDFLPDVDRIVVDTLTTKEDRDRVRRLLELSGYGEWLRES